MKPTTEYWLLERRGLPVEGWQAFVSIRLWAEFRTWSPNEMRTSNEWGVFNERDKLGEWSNVIQISINVFLPETFVWLCFLKLKMLNENENINFFIYYHKWRDFLLLRMNTSLIKKWNGGISNTNYFSSIWVEFGLFYLPWTESCMIKQLQ